MTSARYFNITLPTARQGHRASYQLVQSQSPKRERDHVARFAEYFHRENRTTNGAIDVGKDEPLAGGLEFEAYLFCNGCHYVGACCFQRHAVEEPDTLWTLCWLWLHPYFRGKGIFIQALPEFGARYGTFVIAAAVDAGEVAMPL